VVKAHANAKSAYSVRLHINKRAKTKAKPRLVYLNESISLDSATNAVVEKWTKIAEKSYASLGFDAGKVVLQNGEPLDGRESQIRIHSTNLTKLIMSSLQAAAPQANVVLMNAGSIRIDDILPMPATQYDIIRTLPFGGGLREAEMKGSLLIQTLEQGEKNAGNGGFLQHGENVSKENGVWKLNGNPIESGTIYRVGITEFLLTGKEANLAFLNPSNPGIVKVYAPATSVDDPKSDIRLAVIRYLEKRNRS
jgi:2',3'-cyclic-nucleotide 2'-phosphodiesterase (5'-nucleotidase family)